MTAQKRREKTGVNDDYRELNSKYLSNEDSLSALF